MLYWSHVNENSLKYKIENLCENLFTINQTLMEIAIQFVGKWYYTYMPNLISSASSFALHHDDVIKWKQFPLYWPFVRGIHRSPVNFPHKGRWRGALMFSLICDWINVWVNNSKAGDLRRRRTHYDVIVMTNSQVLRYWISSLECYFVPSPYLTALYYFQWDLNGNGRFSF